MKTLWIVAGLLLAGLAQAQGRLGTAPDDGAMCRSFCDADASKCRKEAAEDASVEADPLVEVRSAQRADKDDGSAQKYDQAVKAADKDRYTRSRRCNETRMACRQKCTAPAAAAASAAR